MSSGKLLWFRFWLDQAGVQKYVLTIRDGPIIFEHFEVKSWVLFLLKANRVLHNRLKLNKRLFECTFYQTIPSKSRLVIDRYLDMGWQRIIKSLHKFQKCFSKGVAKIPDNDKSARWVLFEQNAKISVSRDFDFYGMVFLKKKPPHFADKKTCFPINLEHWFLILWARRISVEQVECIRNV